MDNETPSRKAWLLPACLAAAIIVLFIFLSPSGRGKAGCPSAPAAKTPGPDLVGMVKTTNGVPITNASIFIYTAQPRSGPGFT